MDVGALLLRVVLRVGEVEYERLEEDDGLVEYDRLLGAEELELRELLLYVPAEDLLSVFPPPRVAELL